jgi:hypothetical protein
MSTLSRGRSVLAVVAVACLSLSCQNQSAEYIDPGDLQLVIVSGNEQTEEPFTELPEPLVVKVVNKNGTAGVPNQIVNFVVLEGGGSVYAGTSTTDQFGLAAEYWTLGDVGPQRLEARAVTASGEKLVYGEFRATAVQPPQIFYDEAEFVAATGASVTVTYPNPRGITAAPYSENGVSLVQAFGRINEVKELITVFDGYEFGVSDAENVDITFAAALEAFGLWLQDGYDVGDLGGCAKMDSRFRITFLAGSEVLLESTEDPPVDQAFFIGVSSAEPITKVEIRELDADGNVAGSAYCENDFFSTILTK